MKFPTVPQEYASVSLRIMVGFIFITHGLARLYYSSISNFGEFLNAKGLMFGIAFAWIITIGEIISGTFLMSGYKVKYCALFHILIILSGIFLVHLPKGWFVVGHGSGGAEYSFLILGVLFYLYNKK
ncbi:MAG TPA: DoxX family protein [Saprospiraceae bacterium]|nr:DoxX family protein [Saprospiraceae bacterium]